MFKNYVIIAWRNIAKNKFHASVNLIGLTAGILFCLLIGAHVWGALQVNQKLRNADRQYFLTSIWKDPNLGPEITSIAPLAAQLRADFPGTVANYYRWDGITSGISIGNNHFREGIQLGDSTLLGMFGFKLLHGDENQAMNAPFSIVITAEKARKFFGKTSVVGETLTVQNFNGERREFQITGVLEDLPQNSVTQLLDDDPNGLFVPKSAYEWFGRNSFDDWQNIILPSYVELQPGKSAADLEKAVQLLMERRGDPFLKENLTVRPIALTEYYLQKNDGLVKKMLLALAAIGFFILIMAIVNFVNLTIGNAGTRIREIGVRKSLGGQKKQLVLQFLTESFLLVLAATTASLALYPFASPGFGGLVGKNLPGLLDFPLTFAALPIAVIALIGSLSGVYPALVLASMKTVDALGGKFKTAASNIMLRRGLVGFQFGIAMLVLISLSVVSHQVSHFFGKSLGYQKEFVLTAQVPRDWTPAGVRKMRTVRDQFEAMPQVERASLSFEIPNGNNGSQPMLYQQSADSISAIATQAMVTDEHYLETYQIPLLSGKFFEAGGQDSGRVVLNEKAVASLGFESPEAAIGQQVRIPRDPTVFTIKGVVKDFQFGSMKSQVQPMVLFSVDGNPIYRFLSFKIQPNATEATIAAITQKWSELLPGSAFEYSFMDETLRKIYNTEFQLKQSATVAAWLALIISMLGVLGLVSLNIQRRSKEVGVRKVLGASTTGIIGLFLKEFAMLLLVAGIIASPIAWHLTNSWLAQYASRTEPTAAHYVVAIAGLSIATLVLISLQSMRAALANPVKSLRSE